MITRNLSPKILSLAEKFPVISLTGPRQSGKTTLIKSIFPEHAYFNLENPEHRQIAEKKPKDLLNHHKKGVIIDEAQNVPDIFSYVQVTVDERDHTGEFILSGSHNFLLMEKITQSLAGRVAIFSLLPLSMRELITARKGLDSVLDYILHGFFPRLHDKGIGPPDFYPTYIQTYTERDVRQIINLESLEAFQRFLALCAGRVGRLFNQNEVGSLTGINQTTARKWLSVLKTSYQVFTLPPYFRNFEKRIVKTPKLYFWDTGMACSLLGIRSVEELRNHFALGALFENFVIVEILKSFYNSGFRPNAYFWRDHSGKEVDLLIDEGGKLYPIEIKSGHRLQTSYFKNLNWFNEVSDTPAFQSHLIYGGDLSLTMDEINVRPWNELPDLAPEV